MTRRLTLALCVFVALTAPATAQRLAQPVGFAPTDSTKSFLEEAAKTEGMLKSYGIMTNFMAVSDQDPRSFLRALLSLIQETTPAVTFFDSLSAARQAGLGTTIVGDVKVRMGSATFTKTSVQVSLTYRDRSNRILRSYTGSGEATIGYPAFTYRFKAAGDEALAALRSQMRP